MSAAQAQQLDLLALAAAVLARNSERNSGATDAELRVARTRGRNSATANKSVAAPAAQQKAQLASGGTSGAQAQQGLQGLRVAPLGERNSATVLHEAATEACRGLSGYITPARLLTKLAPKDISDLQGCPTPLPFLRSFAGAVVWTAFRRQGIAPPGWDKAAHCDRCGPVLLWAPVKVGGCPWCWNRLHGVKIPRPEAATQDSQPFVMGSN